MATKQNIGALAPDGSMYVTITDGATNLVSGVAGTGGQSVTLVSSAGTALQAINTAADATTTGSVQGVGAENLVFNGTTWDRVRSIANASQTTTTGVPVAVQIPQTTAVAGMVMNQTTAVASSKVLKASACNVYSINCTAGASAGFVNLYDATTAPVDGAVTPVLSFPVAANANFFINFNYPVRCATGAVVAFSTTGPFTQTLSATALLGGQAI